VMIIVKEQKHHEEKLENNLSMRKKIYPWLNFHKIKI